MSELAKLLKSDRPHANPANPANAQGSISEISGISTGLAENSHLRLIDFERARKALENRRAATQARREAVQAMMDEAPAARKYFWLIDSESLEDAVILTFGIRGTGTGELTIERDCYDPLKLLEVLQGMEDQ